MTTTSDHLETWTAYQAAWADISAAERRRLVQGSVHESCAYTDPSSVSHGHDELVAKMESTQRTFPGARFRNDVFLDHHDQAISRWTMLDASDRPMVVGSSYARFDDQGRLTTMVGFFEPAA